MSTVANALSSSARQCGTRSNFELLLTTQAQFVTVSAAAPPAQTESVTPTTLMTREEITDTPGASRANSLAMITDYAPGAYVTHDQLHIRGGHQVNWLIDGVSIPNTNISSNLGPQVDPIGVNVMEAQRGGYSADYGDRTYGIFNVEERTGFERNNEAELVLSAGNFYRTDGYFAAFMATFTRLRRSSPSASPCCR